MNATHAEIYVKAGSLFLRPWALLRPPKSEGLAPICPVGWARKARRKVWLSGMGMKEAVKRKCLTARELHRVKDGIRTRDPQNHNLVL